MYFIFISEAKTLMKVLSLLVGCVCVCVSVCVCLCVFVCVRLARCVQVGVLLLKVGSCRCGIAYIGRCVHDVVYIYIYIYK